MLTEITDQGPVKKEDYQKQKESKFSRDEVEEAVNEDDLNRYEWEGELDPELILPEFSENGPVKAGSVDITSGKGSKF